MTVDEPEAVVVVRVELRVPVAVGVVEALARRRGLPWTQALAMIVAEVETRCADGPAWLPAVAGRRIETSATLIGGSPL